MSSRYAGGYAKNSVHVRATTIDAARANVPTDLESLDVAREKAPARVAQLQAAGYGTRLVHDWRVFVDDGSLSGREIRTPSEFAALLAVTGA